MATHLGEYNTTDILTTVNEGLKNLQFKNVSMDKRQFYTESLELFLELDNITQDKELTVFGVEEQAAIDNIVYRYRLLCRDYPGKEHLVKLWSLCSLLYFSSSEDYLTQLTDWTDTYYPVERGSEWTNICNYLIRGDYDTVFAELHHMDTDNSALINAIHAFLSIQEGDNQALIEWRDQLPSQDMIYSVGAARVFSILRGDETGYGELNFVEKLMAASRFKRPWMSLGELQAYAQTVFNKNDSFDKACSYLLMGCLDDVLGVTDDLWLQVHLGHVFICIGEKMSQTYQLHGKGVIMDPVYLCINEYAKLIVKEETMWKEAVMYLARCKENSQHWIIQLLGEPAVLKESIEFLKELLQIASEHGLDQVERHIHSSLGKRYEVKNDIHQAALEFAAAQDRDGLDKLSHQLFNEYLRTGKLGEVVTNVKEVEISPHYALLVTYKRFRTHLEQKEYKEASERLLEILKEKDILPLKFDIVLMIDNLSILEDKSVHFSYDQFIELIRLFKLIEKDDSKQKFIHNYYKLSRHEDLPAQLVVAKLRERLAYKASLSQ